MVGKYPAVITKAGLLMHLTNARVVGQPGTKCPAATATCHRCNRKGHYKSQCFSKTVASTDELEVKTPFLGVVSEGTVAPWTVCILVGNKRISFKIDTGAEVTAISDGTFWKFDGVKLKKPSLWTSLTFAGCYWTVHDQSPTWTEMYQAERVLVVKDLQANLLGLPALIALKLLLQVDTVTKSTSLGDVVNHFVKVFEGLSNLGEEYTIQLKPNAVPYSLYTQHNIALPQRFS